MEKDGNGSRLTYYKENINGDYLLYLHNIISSLGYCKPELPKIYIRNNTNDNTIKYSFNFKSYTFSSFNWIYYNFYNNNNIKIIPYNIDLYNLLTPLALAIWVMDDGYYINNKGISFKSNSFTLKEIKYIGNILKTKYSLDYSIIKTGTINQYNIYLSKKSAIILGNIIKKHLTPSMYYKIPLECFKLT
ncbi:Cytochrome b mRNA maturase bI2 (mitochondrion) [Yarrowia sp. E02]|nr:Cytochrome b mRNA maturase bI2 [Yarrowia sp. E02]